MTTESTTPTRKSNNLVSDASDPALVGSLRNKITDQEEQIQTLIKKRRDDLEKLKEFERTKIQLDQVIHFSLSHTHSSSHSFPFLSSYKPTNVKLRNV